MTSPIWGSRVTSTRRGGAGGATSSAPSAGARPMRFSRALRGGGLNRANDLARGVSLRVPHDHGADPELARDRPLGHRVLGVIGSLRVSRGPKEPEQRFHRVVL